MELSAKDRGRQIMWPLKICLAWLVVNSQSARKQPPAGASRHQLIPVQAACRVQLNTYVRLNSEASLHSKAQYVMDFKRLIKQNLMMSRMFRSINKEPVGEKMWNLSMSNLENFFKNKPYSKVHSNCYTKTKFQFMDYRIFQCSGIGSHTFQQFQPNYVTPNKQQNV